jgi:[ribosomal protein S18]-alanine N-acetyltransferase
MTIADHIVVGEVGFRAWQSSSASEPGFDRREVIAMARDGFVDYPAAARGDVAVAELEGRVVGWGAREDAPDYISDIWVDPACQGRGIGSALMHYFLARIEADGFRIAKIHTRATNSGAIRLYERMGFAIVWRGEEFNTALEMPLQKVHMEKRID